MFARIDFMPQFLCCQWLQLLPGFPTWSWHYNYTYVHVWLFRPLSMMCDFSLLRVKRIVLIKMKSGKKLLLSIGFASYDRVFGNFQFVNLTQPRVHGRYYRKNTVIFGTLSFHYYPLLFSERWIVSVLAPSPVLRTLFIWRKVVFSKRFALHTEPPRAG